MTIVLRIIAWLLAAAVTFATLGPPRFRPHSDLGQDGEHALAFILVGLAFGLAYTRNRLLTASIAVVHDRRDRDSAALGAGPACQT